MATRTYRLEFNPSTTGYQWKIETIGAREEIPWIRIATGEEAGLTIFVQALEDNFPDRLTLPQVVQLWRLFRCGLEGRFIE